MLTVTPRSSMIDSKLNIRATGLEANSSVTVRSVLAQESLRPTSGSVKFEGHGHYIADETGVVSVPDQTSLGGTYNGVDAMGLLWSMVPSPDQRLGARIVCRDVTKPMVVHLSLHRGHLDTETLLTAEPDATATAERWYMAGNVERITVHSGRLRGSVFKPKGSGPFPGVIDMHGSTGGLIETRAAALASHDLACYALPYFNYEDLPSRLWNLELEYFKEAVDWMADQHFVSPGGIGMVGISTGAQIALATVSIFPEKVNAVVSISGMHVSFMVPVTVKGQPMPFVEFDIGGVKPSVDIEGALDVSECHKNVYAVTEDDDVMYKLENAPNCQFLFVVGESDKLSDNKYCALEAMKRLERHGCHNYQLLSYPKAGHMIEVPYAPALGVLYSLFVGSVVDHGGTAKATAKANEDSWRKIVKFLQTHCGRNTAKL